MIARRRDPDVDYVVDKLLEYGVLDEEGCRRLAKVFRALEAIAGVAGGSPVEATSGERSDVVSRTRRGGVGGIRRARVPEGRRETTAVEFEREATAGGGRALGVQNELSGNGKPDEASDDGQGVEAEGGSEDRRAEWHGLFASGTEHEDLQGGETDETSGAPSQDVSDEDVAFHGEDKGGEPTPDAGKAPWRKSRVRFEVSAEALQELYLEKGMTAKEIAALHQVSPATVNARLREFGLTGKKRPGMRAGQQ